jgi:carboxyl-terminal processing protease
MEYNKEDKIGPPSYKIMQPLLLAAAIAIGMMLGYKMNENIDGPLLSTEDAPAGNPGMVGKVEELLRFIEYKYVDSIDKNMLIEKAIGGIFDELDPHSAYLTPIDVAEVSDEMNGKFQGIGIENFLIDDTVSIFRVVAGSPADKAGIKAFDRLIAVNDTVVAGRKMKYDDIRKQLRRVPGSELKLKILRQGKLIDIKVAVDIIPVPTVTSVYLPEAEAALFKIERFGNKTYKEFMAEVEKHFTDNRGGGVKNKAKHLILDLRDNPGGYLPEATNILCQIFEEKDQLLVYTEGKSNKRNEYVTNGKRFFNIDQVVVLIDENSASASEIVAGAIQDWDRGHIIGRRSFGKGLVQEQYDLSNGGAIRLTVARYYTPTGRSIQKDYSDMNGYYHDFENRHKNGDLFHKDSSNVKKTKSFETKILKRKVKSEGGISPDIFVAMDTIFRNSDFITVKSYLAEFVCLYGSRTSNVRPQTAQDINGWNGTDAFYSQLLSFVSRKEQKVLSIPISKLKYLDSEVKSIWAHASLSQKEAHKLILDQDRCVKEAIKVIKEKRALK